MWACEWVYTAVTSAISVANLIWKESLHINLMKTALPKPTVK